MGDACKHGQTMFCTDCFTEATTPSAVPATTDRITELLAAHLITRVSYNGGRNAECVCACDETVCRNSEQDLPHTDRHRAHVASLLAVLVADAQTDAWDEGHHAGVFNATADYDEYGSLVQPVPHIDNPYRKVGDSGEGEKLQQQINASEGEEHAGSDKVVGTHTPHNTPSGDENP